MKVRSAKWKVRSKWKVSGLFALLCILQFTLCTFPTSAQGIRDRIRGSREKTTISEAQASELTLTLTTVEVRPIQVWVRTAGTGEGQVLRAVVPNDDAMFIKPDQRVRAFPPENRSSMFQARVTQVTPGPDQAQVVI